MQPNRMKDNQKSFTATDLCSIASGVVDIPLAGLIEESDVEVRYPADGGGLIERRRRTRLVQHPRIGVPATNTQ